MKNKAFLLGKIVKSRKTAAILSIFLLLSMLFFTFFIAEVSEHDCIGDDCPICAHLHMCENCIKLFSYLSPAIILFVLLINYDILEVKKYFVIFGAVTPITQKVKLND